jgi:hypothetical protein
LTTLKVNGWRGIGSIIDVRGYGPAWDVLFNVDSGDLRLERVRGAS